jgi:hypothetical protein
MSMNVEDVIKWLQTLSADDAVYIDMGGPENVYHLFSEMDEEAYLKVGGQHLETDEDEADDDDSIFEDDDDDWDEDEEDEDYEDDDDWPTEED